MPTQQEALNLAALRRESTGYEEGPPHAMTRAVL